MLMVQTAIDCIAASQKKNTDANKVECESAKSIWGGRCERKPFALSHEGFRKAR